MRVINFRRLELLEARYRPADTVLVVHRVVDERLNPVRRVEHPEARA